MKDRCGAKTPVIGHSDIAAPGAESASPVCLASAVRAALEASRFSGLVGMA